MVLFSFIMQIIGNPLENAPGRGSVSFWAPYCRVFLIPLEWAVIAFSRQENLQEVKPEDFDTDDGCGPWNPHVPHIDHMPGVAL